MDQLIRNEIKKRAKLLETVQVSEIIAVTRLLLDAQQMGRRVFICGNGGSASTAQHFVTDLGVGTLRTGTALNVISLVDNLAVITATANDVEYSQIFARQLHLTAAKNDVVILISASGSSSNLIEALHTAKQLDCHTVALTGFDGGFLHKMADLSIHIPTPQGDYGSVEDLHLAICHIITTLFREQRGSEEFKKC